MRIIRLQSLLTLQELTQLNREFPQFLFLTSPNDSWENVEILFGNRLSSDEIKKANKLKWIHCPSSQISRLCLNEIERQEDILVTQPRDENLFQIGEYVMATVLAISKNLFEWKEAQKTPHSVWDCKWRNTMMTLKDKIFLQIGRNKMGFEIAKRASENYMRVLGVSEKRSFFPHCRNSYDFSHLKDLIPEATVVNLTLPLEKSYDKWFGEEFLSLMNPESILSILGSVKCIDESYLIENASKWRAILIDADYQFPIPPHSKLWSIPNILITPEISPRPKSLANEAFKIFRYNLRQYYHGNFSEMKNLIDPSLVCLPSES